MLDVAAEVPAEGLANSGFEERAQEFERKLDRNPVAKGIYKRIISKLDRSAVARLQSHYPDDETKLWFKTGIFLHGSSAMYDAQ